MAKTGCLVHNVLSNGISNTDILTPLSFNIFIAFGRITKAIERREAFPPQQLLPLAAPLTALLLLCRVAAFILVSFFFTGFPLLLDDGQMASTASQ